MLVCACLSRNAFYGILVVIVGIFVFSSINWLQIPLFPLDCAGLCVSHKMLLFTRIWQFVAFVVDCMDLVEIVEIVLIWWICVICMQLLATGRNVLKSVDLCGFVLDCL